MVYDIEYKRNGINEIIYRNGSYYKECTNDEYNEQQKQTGNQPMLTEEHILDILIEFSNIIDAVYD